MIVNHGRSIITDKKYLAALVSKCIFVHSDVEHSPNGLKLNVFECSKQDYRYRITSDLEGKVCSYDSLDSESAKDYNLLLSKSGMTPFPIEFLCEPIPNRKVYLFKKLGFCMTQEFTLEAPMKINVHLLAGLVVRKSATGSGIGACLVESVLGDIVNMEDKLITFTDNNKSSSFYKKLMFSESNSIFAEYFLKDRP